MTRAKRQLRLAAQACGRNYYVCFTFITAVPGAVSVGADLVAAEVAALAKVKACLPGSGLRPVSSMLPGRDFPGLMVSCASVIVFTMKVVEVALPLACQSLADRIMFEPVANLTQHVNYDHQEVHTSVTVVVRADSCLATLGGLA
jgi:phosphoglycerol transferase MdoB-like AlkP superfamily enzyme